MASSTFSLYVLVCKDQSLYCGISNDVKKRVETHNKGKGARYVKSRLPCTLLYQKEIGTRSEALKAEYAFKQLTRKQKVIYLRQHL